jgi:hypothetical protein
MNRRNFLFFGIIIFLFAFEACTKDTVEPIEDPLSVQFFNDANSDYSITTIEIRSRGLIGEEDQVIGTWESNLLSGGLVLDPGSSTSFNLDIPSLEWGEYRIGVDDGNGNTVMVMTDQGVGIQGALPISHVGSNNRTVSVVVKYDTDNDIIYISSWSDFSR